MRLFAFLAQRIAHDWRLLAIGLASLLLHLAAIAWLDIPPEQADGAASREPLAVRIAHSVPVPRRPEPAPSPAPVPTPVPDPLIQPAPAPEPAPRPEPLPSPERAPITIPLVASEPADVIPAALPGQYRVSPAPPARIGYRVSGAGGDGAASLAWNSDGSSYRIEFDGLLGELESDGGLDDGGIAPLRVRERVGAGHASTEFDRVRGVIASNLGARRDQLAGGSQDRASLLLQLAGMGVANPDQLHGVLEFWIGGAGGARLERYEVMEMENVDTGIGAQEALRLVRLAPADAPKLELWLAPAQSWLPVQLRLTQPNGEITTQTLATIEIAASP